MTTITVSTTAGLLKALATATGGELILLAPGSYSGLSLSNINPKGVGKVWVESQSPANPAVLKDLTLTHSSNLVFAHLTLSTAGTAVGAYGADNTIPFQVGFSSKIAFENILLTGSPTGTLANTISGIIIRNSTDVVVANSEFQYLHNAINQLDNTGLYIENNFFHNLYDDGIRGGGTSQAVISGNRFTSMHMDPTDTDHPDCIQFWTSGTTASAKDITIEDNFYNRGAGNVVQGVFFGNELNIQYQDITIKNNVIAGSMWNGLAVADAHNVYIAGNTVAGYPDELSRITILDDTNIDLAGNAATRFLNEGGNVELAYISDTWIDPVRDGGAALLKQWLAANPNFVKTFGAQGASLNGEPAAPTQTTAAVAISPDPTRFVAAMAAVGANPSAGAERLGGAPGLAHGALIAPGIVHGSGAAG